MRKEKLRKKQCLIIAMSILTVPFNNIHHVQATETDQQYRNLEKLCLVWGYTKYRHPVFLSGQKDWDEELLNLIDPVSEASNDDEVNKILYEWFEGLGDNTWFWNYSCGIVLILSRFIPIIGQVAIAGLLAGKKYIPETSGTLKTDSVTFSAMTFAVIFIVAALSFFPVHALSTIAEHLSL